MTAAEEAAVELEPASAAPYNLGGGGGGRGGRGAAEEPEPEPEPDYASSSTAAASYNPADYQKPHPDDRGGAKPTMTTTGNKQNRFVNRSRP